MRCLARIAAIVLVVTGCSSGDGDGPPAQGGSAASSVAPAATPADLPQRLASVEWPDEDPEIEAAFERLPATLAGFPAQRPAPPSDGPDEVDGHILTYSVYGREVQVVADPGSGVANPAQGMAGAVVNSGGPNSCGEADHASLFDDLFGASDRQQQLAELERIAALAPTPGELVWLMCTFAGGDATPGGDGTPDPTGMRYVAQWADGGWLYAVTAPSDPLRAEAVEALIAAVQQSGDQD